ncbi:polysaccharide deacetylase family protein [Dactylosporangium sp. CS-047395]|uniref:polysaccharide deacetylase family protein n=1 Tax=Dactylosporangium sp. CS-047395 TaxID=3239936 RepID=UPI003D910F8D
MSAPIPRRSLLLALGGAALLAGCGTDRPAWHGGDIPGDSHPGDSAGPEPTGSALVVPPANPPTAGTCPANHGVVQQPGGPQHYLPCHGTDIALTVDDGPDPAYTPKMLALLARLQIRATFCMIGRSAAAHPDLVKRVLDGGHHIANHTYDHPLNIAKLAANAVHAEIARASDAISTAAGGYRPTLFRAPGGAWSPTVLQQCGSLGLRPLDWSVDPRDWSRPGVQHIVTTIMTQTHPGAIILEHDGGGNREQTLTALGVTLPKLRDAGYTFVQP